MSLPGQPGDRWVCFDVGETLIDETRIWGIWADALGVPRLTVFAALGAAVARGVEYWKVLERFGGPEWHVRVDEIERTFAGFQAADLYPDALPTIAAVRGLGYRTAVVANQPASRHEELLALGLEVDVVAMSEALGVSKPAPEFFARLVELTGAEAGRICYVGDRVDNDVIPAVAAGMRAVWLRRGPWGLIQEPPAGIRPALVIDRLADLPERLPGLW
jgi:FMN hydrolase / 5-amino-6-(5-phospho-D-ribitylamino)uracil phosphatase